MTKQDLEFKLHEMYNNAIDGEKVVMIHLFGIKYADDIQNCKCSTKDIAIAANINESYGTEISKGVKLAKYVKVK